MVNLRKYGSSPYQVALLHGGPGAGGEMAPVARRLSSSRGVLEPIQTAASLDGQVMELESLLEAHADLPATLIGYSWGAWLGFILTAHHPSLVKKLIMVSSGPFQAQYVPRLTETRLSRLERDERREFRAILEALRNPETEDKDALLERLGALAALTDRYDPLPDESQADLVGHNGDQFQQVWAQAAEMRRSGALLALGERITCPVVAVHGDYDPHPAAGVREPLDSILRDFRFILLENCGHTPWIERNAREEFFRVIEAELG